MAHRGTFRDYTTVPMRTPTPYVNAAKIAKTVDQEGTSLREATLKLGLLSGADFDQTVIPERMTRP